MPRVAFTMHLLKGNEEEYKKRHDAIWPELHQLLKTTGIGHYSIFLDEANGNLFGVLEVADEKQLSALANQPVMQAWWKFMSDIMKTNPDHSPVTTSLKEVFYLS